MAEVDPLLPRRLADNAAVRRGEARVYAAAVRALDVLAREIRGDLAASHYVPVSTRVWPAWEAAVEEQVGKAIRDVYASAYDDPQSLVAAASLDARENAVRFMRSVYGRLVRVADEVWSAVQAVLAEGVEKHEAIPDIARKVDAALAEQGAERWRGRATTIARTETIAAFNHGRLDGGRALAAAVGVPERDVFKSWLSTRTDDRTRTTHRAADRQTVPLAARFVVGGARGLAPGDPLLPPSECVNCRCTVLVLLPGDRGYPAHHTPSVAVSLAASGLLTFDFNPAQKRGPDGRWIKYLTQRDAFKSLQFSPWWRTSATAETDLTISGGPEYREWMRKGSPPDHPDARTFNRATTLLRMQRKATPPTTDNVLAWYRPSRNKDTEFPTNPKVGDVIQDYAPISTETQKPTHVKPKVLYAIRIPAGSEGILPIADEGKYAYYEGAQLPPLSKLRVADVREENGQTLVTVDLLPPSRGTDLADLLDELNAPSPTIPQPKPAKPAKPKPAKAKPAAKPKPYVPSPTPPPSTDWQTTGYTHVPPEKQRAQQRRFEDRYPPGFERITSADALPEQQGIDLDDAQIGANPFHPYGGRANTGRGPDTPEDRAATRPIEYEYQINCQRVSAAYEMRRRGYDVAAGAGQGVNHYEMSSVWVDSEGRQRAFEYHTSAKRQEERAVREGEGARFLVFGKWKSGSAHIWNAEVRDGKLVYEEAQVPAYRRNPNDGVRQPFPGHAPSQYVNELSWTGKIGFNKGVGIMRVDDLQPSQAMFDFGWLTATKPLADL